jgi:hypothetical protein
VPASGPPAARLSGLFFADQARQYEEIFLIATGHQVAMARRARLFASSIERS